MLRPLPSSIRSIMFMHLCRPRIISRLNAQKFIHDENLIFLFIIYAT